MSEWKRERERENQTEKREERERRAPVFLWAVHMREVNTIPMRLKVSAAKKETHVDRVTPLNLRDGGIDGVKLTMCTPFNRDVVPFPCGHYGERRGIREKR